MSIRVIRDWKGLAEPDRHAAAAFGNFDGVHLGHQRVIEAARSAAHGLNAPAAVISFEPHPRRYFQPSTPPFRVMSVEQQAKALAELGVDLFYLLPFGEELATMSAEAFARDVLHQALGVRHMAAGFDITFGKGRTGSGATLVELGQACGFGVTIVERVDDSHGMKLSSTAVREALVAGRPEEAAAILGRPFAIEGVVAEGDKLGRQLGFPTLNVDLGDYLRPAFGVYATRTRLPDGREVAGVAYLGPRPTVGGEVERLETYLFDFDEDLYGRTVETALIAYLRPDMKFDGLDALKAQMAVDAAAARRVVG